MNLTNKLNNNNMNNNRNLTEMQKSNLILTIALIIVLTTLIA